MKGAAPITPTAACRLDVAGLVQGVGFRPAVARLAARLRLAGRVANTPDGATIRLEGPAESLDEFVRSLSAALPPGTRLDALERQDEPPAGWGDFRIEPPREFAAGNSETGDAAYAAPHAPAALVPPDVRVCEACQADARDPNSRRRDDYFASCTRCGPRYAILDSLPYERERTAMRDFAPCDACRAEYVDASDRRFHAQTVSCPACGPRVRIAAISAPSVVIAEASKAVAAAIERLRRGDLVALQGVGGYQLLCDATNEAAVARLRRVKRRAYKPLAVLVDDVAAARRLARLGPADADALASPAGPIVIAPRLADAPLAPSVCGRFDSVGVLLPATTLHRALAEALGPLVATSGNEEGDPLVVEPLEAAARLASSADWLLSHDRRIARPIDDGVVRVMAGRQVVVRLARGHAPRPIELPAAWRRSAPEPVLALGGHLKAAIALWNGRQAILGPHLGDLDSVETRRRYDEQLAALRSLYGIDSTTCRFACDEHPDYYATRRAVEEAGDARACEFVQHHHAHVAATMAEHGWLEREVFGAAWDGTGRGRDGTIWGGEFLLATAADFRRVARLRPLRLPGGELAVRQPWRTAAAMLRELGDDGWRFARQRWGASRLRAYESLGQRSWPGPDASSVGRLFDAVAALVLDGDALPDGAVPFEGAAAMELEAWAWRGASPDAADVDEAYPLPLVDGTPAELDWRPLLAALVEDVRRGVGPAVCARRFHAALVEGLLDAAELAPRRPIALGGGAFQNRWLVERCVLRAAERGRTLAFPAAFPPNDGGLAAGQLAVALARITERRTCV